MDTQLNSNEDRQAVDVIRGFEYQFWQTVLAWVNLTPTETLYVECAEDLDIVDALDANAIQVKHQAESITLRSKCIRKAITNYWTLRNENEGRTVKFTLLTTAEIGIERGSPFGKGVAGLKVWNQCRRDLSQLKVLKAFLIDERILDSDLIQAFQQETDDYFLNNLILPIIWRTATPSMPAVKEAVKEKLILHGHQLGVPPIKCAAVSTHLLRAVMEASSNKSHRRLTLSDYYEEFGRQTFEQIPSGATATVFREMQSLMNKMQHQSGAESAIALSELIESNIPPLPPNTYKRSQTISAIKGHLQESYVQVIQGSAGSGKTTLAKQIAHEFQIPVLWVNLRGKSGEQVDATLRQLIDKVRSEQYVVILDDIDLNSAHTPIFEARLAAVTSIVREQNGYVLLTTQQDFPASMARMLALQNISSLVSPFDLNDIEQLSLQMGCPPAQVHSIGVLCEIYTHGHPQLVQAALWKLSADNWQSGEKLADLTAAVAKEKTDARVKLMAQCSPEQLELVFRLSAFPFRFRREQAIQLGGSRIGENLSPIPYPGAIFDSLVGPWLENLGGEYYRVSPLLQDAGARIWGLEILRLVKITVARAILASQRQTQFEAESLLSLSMEIGDPDLMGMVVFSLSGKHEHWEYIARYFSWVAYVGTGKMATPFNQSPTTVTLFRNFQYRIAAEVEPSLGNAIAEKWMAEIDSFPESNEKSCARYVFLLNICLYYQINWPVRFAMVQFAALCDLSGNSPLQREDGTKGFEDEEQYLPLLFTFNLMRCKKASDLADLLDSCDGFTEKTRSIAINSFRPPLSSITLGVNEVWLQESKRDKPNWSQCIEVFEKALSYGQKWKCDCLIEVAARALAIVHEEYLNDPLAALKDIENAEKALGGPSVLLQLERATTLFHHERLEEAIDTWTEALPRYEMVNDAWDYSIIHEHSKAAIAASRMGRNLEAVCFLEHGLLRADAFCQGAFAIGFLGDAALAAWNAKEFEKSISLFAEAIRRISDVRDLRADLGYFRVHKCVGYILMHCARQVGAYPPGDGFEPKVGLCTSPDRDDAYFDLPQTPIEYMWLALNLCAIYRGVNHGRVEAMLETLLSSQLPVVRWHACDASLKRRLLTRTLRELPCEMSRWNAEFRLSKQHVEAGLSPHDAEESAGAKPSGDVLSSTQGTDIFAIAATILIAHSEFGEETLKDWRENASRHSVPSPYIEAIDILSELHFEQTENLLKILYSVQQARIRRIMSAALLCGRDGLTAEEIFYVHFAHFMLFVENFWPLEVESAFTSIVVRQWKQAIMFKAALKSPRLTVPAIEDALASQHAGYKKIALILLAAEMSVSIKLPTSERQKLQDFAAGNRKAIRDFRIDR